MGSMISVVATIVFLVLLFHAFWRSEPAREPMYRTKSIIIPRALVEKRA